MLRLADSIRKLKQHGSSVECLTHQFLQRCNVSGTAKGKAKIKAGQQLKRSKVSTKKGSPAASISDRTDRRSEFDILVQKCLVESSAPVRHLKPKERAREAEREKMGLISEARKKEIENFKKSKSKAKSDEPMIIGTNGLDLISLGLVDVDKIPKYELTVEDGRKLAKEYSRFLMRKHRQRQKAESTLLKLKKEAIEALPEHLKAAALVPDLTPFPANRFMATLTPPIEGYIDKVKEAAKKSAVKAKLR